MYSWYYICFWVSLVIFFLFSCHQSYVQLSDSEGLQIFCVHYFCDIFLYEPVHISGFLYTIVKKFNEQVAIDTEFYRHELVLHVTSKNKFLNICLYWLVQNSCFLTRNVQMFHIYLIGWSLMSPNQLWNTFLYGSIQILQFLV